MAAFFLQFLPLFVLSIEKLNMQIISLSFPIHLNVVQCQLPMQIWSSVIQTWNCQHHTIPVSQLILDAASSQQEEANPGRLPGGGVHWESSWVQGHPTLGTGMAPPCDGDMSLSGSPIAVSFLLHPVLGSCLAPDVTVGQVSPAPGLTDASSCGLPPATSRV